MLFSFGSRETVLACLPQGGAVAEVGVNEGAFSRQILDIVKPAQLHLIDPWEHQASAEYLADPVNADDATQVRRYEGVLASFAADIGCGRVHVHRDFSPQAADRFADASLDWIYIDGNHSRDAVAADLAAWAPKIKPDGFILGHDYARHDFSMRLGFGVADAVDAFVMASGWCFAALTAEVWGTYVLSRSMTSQPVKDFVLALALRTGVVEIRNFPAARPMMQHSLVVNGDLRPIPSF